MGYWDRHPLGGDEPIEAVLLFFEELGVFDDFKCMMEEPNFEEASNIFTNKLKTAIENEELLNKAFSNKVIRKNCFIIPFTVAQYSIKFSDIRLVERLKMCISDGGASNRGYTIDISSIENNYNEFKSPSDYASQLRDNWEDIAYDGSLPSTSDFRIEHSLVS